MRQYTSKVFTVEAVQVTPETAVQIVQDLAGPVVLQRDVGVWLDTASPTASRTTPDDLVSVPYGSWIVRDSQGMYALSDSQFRSRFEK